MQSLRFGLVPLPALLLLAACSAAETAPPPVSAAPVVSEPPEEAAAPEPAPQQPATPQISLQDRWRTPFAVVSRGRPSEREERLVVVPASAAPVATPSATAVSAPAALEGPAEPRASAGSPSAPARTAPASARAATGTAAPRRAESAGTRTHKVEWGETWYGIARRYEISPAALAAANPEVNPERLRSGQVLRIPSGTASAPGQRTHTVGAGDSLWGIARRYGVSMEEIRKANGLQDDRVRLGQRLIIPKAEGGR